MYCIYTHTHTYIYVYMYNSSTIYIYIYIVWRREKEIGGTCNKVLFDYHYSLDIYICMYTLFY